MNPYTNKKLFSVADKKAEKLGVDIRVSKTKNKKLDVITKSGKIIPIGDKRYEDYNIHKDAKRRANYKSRHQSNRTKRGTAGYYADKILW